jgi:hypothetical protein
MSDGRKVESLRKLISDLADLIITSCVAHLNAKEITELSMAVINLRHHRLAAESRKSAKRLLEKAIRRLPAKWTEVC